MSNKVEIVSEDLARELLTCPICNCPPVIYCRMWTAGGRLPRRQISVGCYNCSFESQPDWHDTLYEAVSIWELKAKLSGARERAEPVSIDQNDDFLDMTDGEWREQF